MKKKNNSKKLVTSTQKHNVNQQTQMHTYGMQSNDNDNVKQCQLTAELNSL